MNNTTIFVLKFLRKIYSKTFGIKSQEKPKCDTDPDSVSNKIYDVLMKDEPCMMARFGSNELLCVKTYLGVKAQNKNLISFVTGKSFDWWWNEQNLENMHLGAGFFPPTIKKIEQFCELMLQEIPEVDILASWLSNEKIFEKELRLAHKVHLRLLEPFWTINPWTRALAGKKVLVIHPFAKTIEQQYQKKDLLFEHNVLPDFELKTIKSVLSLANEDTAFSDWFEALNWMKTEIDKKDYDICLIGAGAYGFPLAAHVKRRGKKAVHLGGALQLLFGIKGKRWEDPNYGVKEWGIPYGSYTNLINEYWVRPNDSLKPKNAENVEGACYW
jgi:hypothetical protein